MNRILELIHEWKNTICVSSKHKEDLTNIRDMHRLLGYKGMLAVPSKQTSILALPVADSLDPDIQGIDFVTLIKEQLRC